MFRFVEIPQIRRISGIAEHLEPAGDLDDHHAAFPNLIFLLQIENDSS